MQKTILLTYCENITKKYKLVYINQHLLNNKGDLMEKKNSVSGVLYVSRNKCASCQKGYVWSYNNSERKLTATSLFDLKKRVVECGLAWVIIDDIIQQKAFLFDEEVNRLLLDYEQKYIVLSKNKQDIKDNHKKLKQLLIQEKNNHKNNINNKIKQLKLERKTHNEQYKQARQSIQKTRQDLKNTFKKKEKILLADMDKISKDQANIINEFFMPDEKLDEQYRILGQQLDENKQNFLIQDEKYKKLQNSIKQRHQQSRMVYKSQIDKLNDDINILQEEYLENKKKLDDNLELQLNVIKENQYNLTQRRQYDIIDLEYNILYNQS